jgi:hypothetical protein
MVEFIEYNERCSEWAQEFYKGVGVLYLLPPEKEPRLGRVLALETFGLLVRFLQSVDGRVGDALFFRVWLVARNLGINELHAK